MSNSNNSFELAASDRSSIGSALRNITALLHETRISLAIGPILPVALPLWELFDAFNVIAIGGSALSGSTAYRLLPDADRFALAVVLVLREFDWIENVALLMDDGQWARRVAGEIGRQLSEEDRVDIVTRMELRFVKRYIYLFSIKMHRIFQRIVCFKLRFFATTLTENRPFIATCAMRGDAFACREAW